MATSSIYRPLILDTPEAVRNMEIAFERAETEEEWIPWCEPRICRDPEFLDSIMYRINRRRGTSIIPIIRPWS